MSKIAENYILETDRGIFGFGLSHNDNLDLMNVIVLAFTGLGIKIFFPGAYTRDGTIGPATTTLWGYGLTTLSMVILLFISFYLVNKKTAQEKNTDSSKLLEKESSLFTFLKLLLTKTLPIFLTIIILVYLIALNYIFMKQINSNNVTNTYGTYSLMSTLLIFLQIVMISKYIFSMLKEITKKTLTNTEEQDTMFAQNGCYILTTLNLLFVIILNILLAFFSTDG